MGKEKGELLGVYHRGLAVRGQRLVSKSDSKGRGNSCKGAMPMQRCKRCGFNTWVGKIPSRTAWQPASVFLPGESHGQRSLARYGPWFCTE